MIKSFLPFFQHDFQQTVWKTAVEPDKGLLAVELRDQQQAEVSFSLLDLNTRSFIFDRYAMEENWWVGLAAVQNNSLLIKQYHDSQQPGKQGLVAVNIQTKEVEWWREDFQLVELMDQAARGFTTVEKNRVSIVLSLSDGSEIADRDLRPLPANAALQNPQHYTDPSGHFETVKNFLAETVNIVAVGACDYLELKNFVVVSYFVREGQSLANELIIFNEHREILLSKQLGSGLKAFASGTFFVFNKYLVFITNKTQLCVYELAFDF